MMTTSLALLVMPQQHVAVDSSTCRDSQPARQIYSCQRSYHDDHMPVDCHACHCAMPAHSVALQHTASCFLCLNSTHQQMSDTHGAAKRCADDNTTGRHTSPDTQDEKMHHN